MASTVDPAAGLCVNCVHVKALASSRGSVFYMCQLAERDAAFARYPRLPVLSCRGYAAAPPELRPAPRRDANKGNSA